MDASRRRSMKRIIGAGVLLLDPLWSAYSIHTPHIRVMR